MNCRFFYLLVSVLFFASCEKEETPIPPHAPGSIVASTMEMGTLYADQIWYNLETKTEVSRNQRIIWDLAFDCSENGFHILLNTGNRMQSSLTNDSNLSSVTDTLGLDFTWDSHTGNLDSTAIGDWQNSSNLYVIDRGRDEDGKSLGLAKVMFDSLNETTYFFRIAEFNGSKWTSVSVDKDDTYTHSYFTFNDGGKTILVAPPKTEWDLCFTQYTYIYYDMNPMVAYLVTGISLNRNNPFSVQIWDKPFADITSDDITKYPSSQRIDNIGYNWKYYDFDTGYYITKPSKNYIFRTQSGKMYKIHFLDWYNDKGEKGTVSFESSEL